MGDRLDLSRLQLSAGEGRRLDLPVRLDPVALAGVHYVPDPVIADAAIDVSRTTHGGWSLRLRFETALRGTCMRCLGPAAPRVSVDVREVDQPTAGDDLRSPYVSGGELAFQDWAHDALVLAIPVQVVCREDCLGLCPECGENLNEAGPGHRHEAPPDPRWAKLRELRLE